MIWKGGRSELIIMERDPDAKRQGYSAKSYLRTLEEGLLPHYDETRHFQQDNAGIHRAAVVEGGGFSKRGSHGLNGPLTPLISTPSSTFGLL